jgi:hypothetical protein
MKFILSRHAKEKIKKRKIPLKLIMDIFDHPDQIIEKQNITIYQSICILNNKEYLLRVFTHKNKDPNLVVTVYMTSKISKYRRENEN